MKTELMNTKSNLWLPEVEGLGVSKMGERGQKVWLNLAGEVREG